MKCGCLVLLHVQFKFRKRFSSCSSALAKDKGYFGQMRDGTSRHRSPDLTMSRKPNSAIPISKYIVCLQVLQPINFVPVCRRVWSPETKMKQKLESLIIRIESLRKSGVPLQDAFTIVGLNEKKYNKLRTVFNS